MLVTFEYVFEEEGMTVKTVRAPDAVDVRLNDGRPASLRWRGVEYSVSDTPTPLRLSADHEALTHPLRPLFGWRFQGTSESHDSRVFDVYEAGAGQWKLFAVYE